LFCNYAEAFFKNGNSPGLLPVTGVALDVIEIMIAENSKEI
jgi:hypothetical protein